GDATRRVLPQRMAVGARTRRGRTRRTVHRARVDRRRARARLCAGAVPAPCTALRTRRTTDRATRARLRRGRPRGPHRTQRLIAMPRLEPLTADQPWPGPKPYTE